MGNELRQIAVLELRARLDARMNTLATPLVSYDDVCTTAWMKA
jgi:hypothetical protein